MPDLAIVLQTSKNADAASWIFPEARLTRRFNNILWPRLESGIPDLDETRRFYSGYIERSDHFLKEEEVRGCGFGFTSIFPGWRRRF
jgi:hypothetical protein